MRPPRFTKRSSISYRTTRDDPLPTNSALTSLRTRTTRASHGRTGTVICARSSTGIAHGRGTTHPCPATAIGPIAKPTIAPHNGPRIWLPREGSVGRRRPDVDLHIRLRVAGCGLRVAGCGLRAERPINQSRHPIVGRLSHALSRAPFLARLFSRALPRALLPLFTPRPSAPDPPTPASSLQTSSPHRDRTPFPLFPRYSRAPAPIPTPPYTAGSFAARRRRRTRGPAHSPDDTRDGNDSAGIRRRRS